MLHKLTYPSLSRKALFICLMVSFLLVSASAQEVGRRFPSEMRIIKDSQTGVAITALTTAPANDSKIYQTHPQWTPDGKYVVFNSDRGKDGKWHAFAVSTETGDIIQLTDGEDRSLSLARKNALAYHFRGNKLIELNLGALLAAAAENKKIKKSKEFERVLATLPADIEGAGNFAIDAYEQQAYFSSRQGEDKSVIYSVDFKTGKITKVIEVPFWANHLQTNPWVPGEIMYCWETGADAPQRMWMVNADGSNNREVYVETPDEWVTHEIFMDADHILFNVMAHLPKLGTKPSGIFMLNLRTNQVKVLDQADRGGYWHCAGTADKKWVVGDTFDGNLYRLNVENGKVDLLTAAHRPNSTDPFTKEPHSHHSISPDGKWVLFNSGLLGNSDLMMVPLQDALILEGKR
ncbi:oligogalacturonate lyase family protein [Cesiribacter sp. SM1]|uniref:oligogalacturonate lyase family protein n=1 Tax=Cesiribacter sp. SM1 TaxID=2861196 RepID=UPI001CD7E65D|nr:oligogalacturonate lyase family protein [Cesiribacter sp. SM1]